MKRTEMRPVAVYGVMLLLSVGLMARLLSLVLHDDYVAAASSQSSYVVEICTTRGRIYDCRMRSLAGGRIQYRAVIEPSQRTTEHLFGVLSADELEKIALRLTARSPFVYISDNAAIEGEGVRVFRGEVRYGENSPAVHTVGYVDSAGNGVSGIEYAFNEYLSECAGGITARYAINSTGRSLGGTEPDVTDTTENSRGGVVLTLDYDIQTIAEEAADRYMERGAIVVLELPSGKIRACVSRPEYDRNDIAASLESDAAPFVNRALSAYDVGSVFKLVVAAAALDSGVNPEWACECTGSVQIGRNTFHCSNRTGHGELDMCAAMAGSCNIYFIRLAQQIGADTILDYAERLGFGKCINLAENYNTEAGCLTDRATATNPAALANLAFGQGELMATPVHIARLAAAVADSGMMPEPTVFDCFVTPQLERFNENAEPKQTKVMKAETAEILRKFMIETVTNGTGKKGAAEYVTSAAKTGTAQTGITRDGKNVLQAWYAGFFPADDPKYACAIVVEDGESGGSTAGPVFKYIADSMYEQNFIE